MTAPYVPALLSLPREIRDQIWEDVLVLNSKGTEEIIEDDVFDDAERDNDPIGSENHYPRMAGPLYFANRQLAQEHDENTKLILPRKYERPQIFKISDNWVFTRLQNAIHCRLTYTAISKIVLLVPGTNYRQENLALMFLLFTLNTMDLWKHDMITIQCGSLKNSRDVIARDVVGHAEDSLCNAYYELEYSVRGKYIQGFRHICICNGKPIAHNPSYYSRTN